jgi:ABC-type multidrug transport system ATPase subunit
LLNVLTDSLSINSRGVATICLPGTAALVPQEDQLHGFFTCKSYMHHYARLSGLSRSIGKEVLEKRIENILASLGLTDQSNTIVGDLFLKGLSGGQKRRLSVALEALTDPNTLFLDEPTSGLDAESALQTMEFLKTYARGAPGRRVILTIHQPSSFIWQLIDNVVLLSKGKVMYEGSRENMETFFTVNECPTPAQWNPADWYVTMVNDEFRDHTKSVEDWAKAYIQWEATHQLGGGNESVVLQLVGDETKRSSIAKIADLVAVPTSRSSSILAVGELTYRYFLNLWFNPGILGTRIAMYSMLALMVGALFWGLGEQDDYASIISRSAVLFYCVAFFIFMSVAVLPFTVMERGIVDKEVLNGYYHPIAYQVSQGLATIPGSAMLAFLTSVIILNMLKLSEPYWYFLNMFLALFTSESLAQLVSHGTFAFQSR